MRDHSRAGSGCSTATGPCPASRCSSRCAWPERHSGPAQSLTSRVTPAAGRVDQLVGGAQRRRFGSKRPLTAGAPSGRGVQIADLHLAEGAQAFEDAAAARAASAPSTYIDEEASISSCMPALPRPTGRKTGSSSPPARARALRGGRSRPGPRAVAGRGCGSAATAAAPTGVRASRGSAAASGTATGGPAGPRPAAAGLGRPG